jgi:hypothetical protein
MDARHSGSIKELKGKKKKTVVRQCSFFLTRISTVLMLWLSIQREKESGFHVN